MYVYTVYMYDYMCVCMFILYYALYVDVCMDVLMSGGPIGYWFD